MACPPHVDGGASFGADETQTDLLGAVRESAEYVVANPRHVQLEQAGLDAFVAGFDAAKFASLVEPLQWPLSFTTASRVNFECVRNLLNFGSGFRTALKQTGGVGAFDTICRGVLSLYITHHDITAQTMAGLSLFDVAELFDIRMSVEVPVPESPIMTQFVDTPAKPLAVFLHKVLTDSGRILQQRGAPDFHGLIVRELRPTAEAPLDSGKLLQMLTGVFPAFRDTGTYGGREVWVLKKAQLLVADLARHVAPLDAAWNCDTSRLTVFADNVLPCVLRAMGILRITDAELQDKVDSGKVIAAGEVEVELRLAAVAACERLLKRLPDVTAAQLDLYLWRLGKEEYRALPRHYCQNTVFY